MIYESWKECILDKGVTRDTLRTAKFLGAPGFPKSGVRIDWDQLDPWLKENVDLIEQNNLSMEDIKKANAIKDGIIKDLKIEEERKNTINIKKLDEFITGFGIQLGSTLKSALVKELPHRLVGLDEEKMTIKCKEYYNDLLKVIEKELKDWAKNDDIRTEN